MIWQYIKNQSFSYLSFIKEYLEIHSRHPGRSFVPLQSYVKQNRKLGRLVWESRCRRGCILRHRCLYSLGGALVAFLLLLDCLSPFLSEGGYRKGKRDDYVGTGLCSFIRLIRFCDWWGWSLLFAGLLLVSVWLSSFSLFGDRGSVCSALSLAESFVRFCGAKLGLVGIAGVHTFNALGTLEWVDDTQLALSLGFLYLTFNPPSSLFRSSLARLSIIFSVVLPVKVGVVLLHIWPVKYCDTLSFQN